MSGLQWTAAPLIILIPMVISLVHGVRIEKRCPSNVTLQNGEGWTACGFPNIVSNQRGCGRARNDTWVYRLCDPSYMVPYDDGWAVEIAVRDAEVTSPFACNDVHASAINYTFAFAILKSIRVPDLSSPDLCINDCGAILPELKSREPTEEELEVAMEMLTKAVQTRWNLGICGNDVVTIYSQQYNRVMSMAGTKAANALSPARLKSIAAGAADYYFRRGNYRDGVKYLVSAQKQALLGFSPAYAMLVITLALLVFIMGMLYFVFNIGREVNVLYDESVPTQGMKLLLYFVSLIWIVKGGLMFLGWVMSRPKVRLAYLMAPIVITSVGILLAWAAAPKVNSGIK